MGLAPRIGNVRHGPEGLEPVSYSSPFPKLRPFRTSHIHFAETGYITDTRPTILGGMLDWSHVGI
jgi:hypothetical protein